MRRSQFFELVSDEFGDAYANVILRDLSLGKLSDQTAQQALDSGTDPKIIWDAICEQMQVPLQRRSGLNKTPKVKHAE